MIQNNVIHAAWKYGVKKLLFLGSSCIYPKNAPQPMKEEYLLTGTLEPTNEPYAIAKIAGIKMAENYFRQYGADFISVMPTNLYGPNDNYDLEKSHVLPAMIRKMHLGKCLEKNDWNAIIRDMNVYPVESKDELFVRGNASDLNEQDILDILGKYGVQYFEMGEISRSEEFITQKIKGETSEAFIKNVSVNLWGSGNVFREFLHVDDMADACVFVMENVNAAELYSVPGRTHINIGTGVDITIRELAEIVRKVTNFKGSLIWDQTRPDGTFKKQLDVQLINSLGWNQKITLEKGISEVYKAYLNGNLLVNEQ
jgi:GDP-L-fucose synthase